MPVKLGERTIGFLLTGQIALDLPSPARFEAIARQLTEWGVSMDRNRLEDAYYQSRVLSSDQYAGLIRLLEIFGQQLSAMANRMMVQDMEAEPPLVRRARAFIVGHQADPIDLKNVARASARQYVLLLQNVQEGDRPYLYRISRPCADRESQSLAAQSSAADQ